VALFDNFRGAFDYSGIQDEIRYKMLAVCATLQHRQ
jgi:hypothetical protein